ncbi:MAG: circadian clock KaiB family protein [Nitriliruptorales bacterium]|nr:circadian clock KaiB family protein [Nitriliruptorales bacterium]
MSRETVAIRLRLYITGDGPLTVSARSSVDAIRDRVGGDCEIEIVDVLEDPDTAEREQVLATPTLERLDPPPRLRVVGDLTDLDRALDGLGLRVWRDDENHGPTESPR